MSGAEMKNAPELAGSEALGYCSSAEPRLFPQASTVKGRVLGALLRGEQWTHLDGWNRTGSSRLAHHVYVLRAMGWPIEMIERQVKTADAGRSATIGVYSLPPDVITEAGEAGQEYAAQCAAFEIERERY